MSREIDVNDPGSWDEDDKEYLRNRPEMVPTEHREHLRIPETMAPPAALGESAAMARLRAYVEKEYPDRAGEDPVEVVIDLLGGETVDDDEGDDYDNWKVAELAAEAQKRQMTDAELPSGADRQRKQPWIDALRKWDTEHG
jgi:hypothetical protein